MLPWIRGVSIIEHNLAHLHKQSPLRRCSIFPISPLHLKSSHRLVLRHQSLQHSLPSRRRPAEILAEPIAQRLQRRLLWLSGRAGGKH